MSNETETASIYGAGKKTLRAYVTGLTLSLIFTLTAFLLVGKQLLSTTHLYIALGVLAVLQLIAQVVYFLRINASPEGRWNLMPFLFAILIVGVLVVGSLWIMVNLNYNMVH